MAALQYLKTAVSEARCVREEYLRRVNPDMPSRYRNGYINSINGLIDATTERNETKLMKSAMVFNEYEKWESNLLKP